MDKYVEHVVKNFIYKPSNKAFPFINDRGAWIGSVDKQYNGKYEYCRTMIFRKSFNMAQISWMYHYKERLSAKEIINLDGDVFNNTIENLTKCYSFDEVTPETLRELVDYDPTNPEKPLVLKVDLDTHRRKGYRLGFPAAGGNLRVNLKRKRYALASLVWAYHNGELPSVLIVDHIDHNPSNNTIENLRAVTQAENTRNMSLNRLNKSGYSGVFFNKSKARWYAFGYQGKKQICLGSSKLKTEAVALRKQWEVDRNYHPHHGKIL